MTERKRDARGKKRELEMGRLVRKKKSLKGASALICALMWMFRAN